MDLQTTRQGSATVVALTGRLDAVTAPEFEKRIRALIEPGSVHLVIDFGKLEYISSAGLRSLLVTGRLLNSNQGKMRFAGVAGGVRSVFEMSGFGTIFAIDETVDAAVATLA